MIIREKNTSTKEISKEDFDEFTSVQDSGLYNMMSPEARQQTSLSKSKWLEVIRNYDQYDKMWRSGNNTIYSCDCGHNSC